MTANKNVTPIAFFRQICFTLALFGAAAFPASADAFEILLGTGEPGSFSSFAGRTVCRIVNREVAAVQCRPSAGSGDVHNLTNLQGGSLDIALVDSRMLQDAVNKNGYFEFLDIDYDNLRVIAPLYEVPVILVVRQDADITSLDQLRGKRINAGAPRSNTHLTVDMIMRAKNWSPADFSLWGELPASQSHDTMAFCHGTIQAMFHIGVHPDSSVQQLYRLCNADLVGMDDSDIQQQVNSDPALYPITIAAGVYQGQPGAIRTFGTRKMLVVSADLDEQTAYKIAAAVFSNRDSLKRAHPMLGSIPAAAARLNDTGIQLHPGATKFFSENQ